MMERNSLRYRGIYTKVPGDPSRWRHWERMGHVLKEDTRLKNGGRLPERLICTEGEREFPRMFQLLEEGGTIGFRGSMSGFHMTFLGKGAALRPERMLERADFRRGEKVLVYYGIGTDRVDRAGLEIMEAIARAGGMMVAAVRTEEQRLYLEERYRGLLAGVASLEGIAEEKGDAFDWPQAMPWLPDPDRSWKECEELLTLYEKRTVKPFAQAVTRFLPEEDAAFDLVYERAHQDALGVSTSLVRPITGRVVYGEAMEGRRYSFYAPQIWMGGRRVLMPAAIIDGKIQNAASSSAHTMKKEDPTGRYFYRIRQTG
ncbi:hypothetical protein [Salinithrix halophila]|uniref:Uncharacterized protein n=1 Tax=Salinithrix halophila TaxID=1485204 RepID=A0ABV8JMT3_9BACL